MNVGMKIHPERQTMKDAALRNLACQECGAKIGPESVFCSKCHAPIVRRYCPGCSKLVPNNTAFCPFCGVSAKLRLKEGRSLAATIVPAAVCLTLLMIFVAKSDRNMRHAASSQPAVIETASMQQQPPVSTSHAMKINESTGGAGGAGIMSESGRALNVHAHDLMKERRFAEAIPVLVKALKEFGDNSHDPAYSYALFNLGQSLRLTDQPSKALKVLEKAQEMDPANTLFQHEMEAAQNALALKTATNAKPHP